MIIKEKLNETEEVYDGDTITATIDLGFNITVKEKIRLYGINAPELKGETKAQGIVSRDALAEYLIGKEITLISIKDTQEKYGRYLGLLYVDSVNINDLMVQNRYAEAKEY